METFNLPVGVEEDAGDHPSTYRQLRALSSSEDIIAFDEADDLVIQDFMENHNG